MARNPFDPWRKRTPAFQTVASLPEGCTAHPQDHMVLLVRDENPRTIAQALNTQGIKAVVVRPDHVPETVQDFRNKISCLKPQEAVWAGRSAVGQASHIQEAARALEVARLTEERRLTQIFSAVAGVMPEITRTIFAPSPEDIAQGSPSTYHDDCKMTLVGIDIVHGPGTDWLIGYQPPAQTRAHVIVEERNIYDYAQPDSLDEDGQEIAHAEPGDLIFFFGRDGLKHTPASPAFIHTTPPFDRNRPHVRLVVACATKKTPDFGNHLDLTGLSL